MLALYPLWRCCYPLSSFSHESTTPPTTNHPDDRHHSAHPPTHSSTHPLTHPPVHLPTPPLLPTQPSTHLTSNPRIRSPTDFSPPRPLHPSADPPTHPPPPTRSVPLELRCQRGDRECAAGRLGFSEVLPFHPPDGKSRLEHRVGVRLADAAERVPYQRGGGGEGPVAQAGGWDGLGL